MNVFLLEFTKAFFALFVVMDPLGNIPIFSVLTAKLTSKERKLHSAEAVAVAALILFLFMFFGALILQFFGVSMNSFKFAGGIVLMIIGLKLVMGLRLIEKRAEQYNIAIVPLATPLITGPGSIVTIMMLSQHVAPGIVFLAAVANLLLTWVVLRNANLMLKVIGRQGSDAFSRIMGLILVAIASGFLKQGWSG